MGLFFRYHTKDANGADNDGIIEAFDEKDAVTKLQEQGLVVVSVNKIESMRAGTNFETIKKGQRSNPDTGSRIEINKNIIIFICLVFGSFCFLGGFLYSNFLVRRNQSIGEAKRSDYENKFLEVSGGVITNTYLSLAVIAGTSEIWRWSIDKRLDFNTEIKKYLEKIEDSLDELEKNNSKIESGMQGLKGYPMQYQEAYTVLMDLYSVYSQIYSLALSPTGSLMSFNNKVNDLSSEFTRAVSKLKIYMPKLKENSK